MYVNMQVLGHNCIREHDQVALCSCGNHHCEYHTYKSRQQQVCCVGDSKTTGSIAVSNVIFQKGGKLLVEIESSQSLIPPTFIW